MITAIQAKKLHECYKRIARNKFYIKELKHICAQMQKAIKHNGHIVCKTYFSLSDSELAVLRDILADYEAVGYTTKIDDTSEKDIYTVKIYL